MAIGESLADSYGDVDAAEQQIAHYADGHYEQRKSEQGIEPPDKFVDGEQRGEDIVCKYYDCPKCLRKMFGRQIGKQSGRCLDKYRHNHDEQEHRK